MNYLELAKKSFHDIWKNPFLFIPLALNFVAGFAFLLLLALEATIFLLAFGLPSLDLSAMPSFMQVGKVFLSYLFSTEKIIFIVLFILLDIFLALLAFSYIQAIMLGMCGEIVSKRKTNIKSIRDIFKNVKKFFKQKLKISLIIFLIFFLPFLLLAAITTITFLTAGKNIGITSAIITGIIFFVYAVVAGIFVYFGLFFVNAIIFFQKGNTRELIKAALKTTTKKLDVVLLAWLVIIGINLVVSIAFWIIKLPVALVSSIIFFLFPLVIVLSILQFISQLVLLVFYNIFVFNVYVKKINKK